MGCAGSQAHGLAVKSLSDEELARHSAVELLRAGAAESVVVLAGAGISVSAGIPDFRSPGTGLYDKLEQYDLPYPQAMFDIDYFREAPQAFTQLAKEIWPSTSTPTPTHLFVRLLDDKGMLLRHFTQNIDGLDRAAGIRSDRLVEAHGSFGSGHCIDCRSSHSMDFIKERLFKQEIAQCEKCQGLVKPDIVFFGEQLPQRFTELSRQDLPKAKVVLCMGSSLEVNPFAGLVGTVRKDASRILINRTVPRKFQAGEADLVMQGDCDLEVARMAASLGWHDELLSLCRKFGVPLSGPLLEALQAGNRVSVANSGAAGDDYASADGASADGTRRVRMRM